MEIRNISETQYERAIAEQGVDVALNQQTSGTFRTNLGMLEKNGAVLYYGDHSQSWFGHLTAPADSLGIICAHSPAGALAANGEQVAEDNLYVIPPFQSADLIAPAETSAEAVTIPEARFYELAEAVSPGLQTFDHPGVVHGNAPKLHWLRQKTRMLVQAPHTDSEQVSFDNLIAEWVAWLAQPDAIIERKCSVAREHQAQIARRARTYFSDNYTQPLRMEDACREIGVGLRTLQRCFAHYFQMTPYQYLTLLRYNRARRALLSQDPTTSSVTCVAVDSGFQHLGRFATGYRNLFGELPRDTLAAKPPALAA